MATTKELEAKIDELTARLTTVEAKLGVLTPLQARSDQARLDRELVSRKPRTYREAIEQKAAQERLDAWERDQAEQTRQVEDTEPAPENPFKGK